MRRLLSGIYIPFLFVFLLSCKGSYQPKSMVYNDYRITVQSSDEQMQSLLKPYADSVNKTMGDVIAIAAIDLNKKRPEGTLNNFMADAMMFEAKKDYGVNVDVAFANYGGIRLNSIPAGNITRGKVYELSPFDNIIVLLKLPGNVFQQFLDHQAEDGGWAVAGMSYQIKDKKAMNMVIGGKPFDPAQTYTIATIDYVANGGDYCAMLKPIPQINGGYLYRDALINYLSMINKEGKQITSAIENRVTNAQ